MAFINKERQYQIVTAGAALLAGIVVKAALSAGWRAWRKSDPPQNPENAQVDWSDALTWTIASSVAMGVAGLVARRGAASLFPLSELHKEPLI